jgi:hypothetical protein
MNRAKTRLWELLQRELSLYHLRYLLFLASTFFVSFLVTPAVLFFLVATP